MARAHSAIMRPHCRHTCSPIRGIGFAAVICFGLAHLAGAQASETITATARLKSRGGVEASAPVTITINRFSTDKERDAILAALKDGGTTGVRNLLTKRDQIGSVQVGGVSTALKYAYARTTAGGRLITAVTEKPIAFVGGGVPGAPDRAGFDLGLVMVEVMSSGAGHGELVPAAKVKADAQGAIVTDDYGADVVQLSDVVKK
jgi:hypothetical protein